LASGKPLACIWRHIGPSYNSAKRNSSRAPTGRLTSLQARISCRSRRVDRLRERFAEMDHFGLLLRFEISRQ